MDLGALDDDLLLEILLRVQAKPLTRLKLVSKHWESLITTHHPSFLQKQGPVGLICPDRKIPYLFEFIPLNDHPTESPFSVLRLPGGRSSSNPYRIQQSSNGLLLICSTSDTIHFNSRGIWSPLIVSCWVYNPTTKGVAQIHISSSYKRYICGLNLAFDPATSPGYKVVCIRSSLSDPEELFRIEIYSSQSRAWKLSTVEPFGATARFDSGVYWNGCVHWVDYLSKQLLYFNVDQEELGKVPLPPTMRGDVGYFGESSNYLHIVELVPGNKSTTSFNLHDMKKGCSEWFVKYHIDLTRWTSNIIVNEYRIFSLVRRVDEGTSFLFFEACSKFIRYNLDHNTFEEILAVSDIESPTFQHIESLADV